MDVLRVKRGCAVDTDRSAAVHAESPLGNVEMMRAKIGLLPAAVVPEKAKQVMHAILVVGSQRCGAKPAVEVKPFRRGAIWYRFASTGDPVRTVDGV